MPGPEPHAVEPDRAAAARSASSWARTLQATVRAHSDGAWRPVQRDATAVPTAPAMRGRTLAARLRGAGDGIDEAPGDNARYRIGSSLGRGATAGVWSVFDRALRRQLAAKVLDAGAADVDAFIAEARTTASLQHPNVAPVHELDIGEDGRPYFTMYRVEGRSLGSELAAAIAGEAPAPAVNALVSIVIAVAHALSYAHHRGIVHQDVKPDNIMLGSFGEVLLVDWGSAQRIERTPHVICGTPLYMAPEQARREAVDARSDVYALGATLFHALYLRPPIWADEEAAFWDAKRTGALGAPRRDERRRAPAPLAAIALKALAPDPAARYQSVEELVVDLRSFQAGLAVSAERPPLALRCARWCRRNARAIAIGVPVAAIIAVLGLLVAGERLKQMATWGAPVIVEDCRDPSLERWAVAEGSWEVRDGAIVCTGANENELILRERFDGDIAIEYDAWFAPGTQPGDLSALWCPNVSLDDGGRGWIDIWSALQVQFGARNASFSELIYGGRHSYALERPIVGRRYHVRLELRDTVASLSVDGREVCRHVDALPLPPGRFALYGYWPGKCFANIRVYQIRAPQLVAATAIGDSYLRDGVYERAESEYQRVIDAHPGTPIAAEAAFRLGLARWRDAQPDQAELAWRAVAGTPWADEVELLRVDAAITRGDHVEAIARIDRLAGERPALVPRLGDLWAMGVEALVEGLHTPAAVAAADAYLDARERHLRSRRGTEIGAARALLFLERWQEVLDRFPDRHWECCAAVSRLGHPERVLSDYPEQRTLVTEALQGMGQWERFPEVLGVDWAFGPEANGYILRDAGRDADVLRIDPTDLESCCDLGDLSHLDIWGDGYGTERVMSLLGRIGEMDPAKHRSMRVLMGQGRVDEALALGEARPEQWAWPRFLVGVRRAAAGDLAGAAPWFSLPPARAYDQFWLEPARTLIPPLIAQLAGDAGAVGRAAAATIAERRWLDRQRPCFIARRLRHAIDDDAFLAQPYKRWLQADLVLTRAVDHDARGEGADALADYRAWAAMPRWQRAEVADPVLEEFAAWRIAALSAPNAPNDAAANGATR